MKKKKSIGINEMRIKWKGGEENVGERKWGKEKKINWKIIGRVRRTWERGNNFIDYRH
jgi:hypothetical protein